MQYFYFALDEIISFRENSDEARQNFSKNRKKYGFVIIGASMEFIRFGFPNDRLFAYLNGRAQEEQQLAVFNTLRGSKQPNFHQKLEHFGTEVERKIIVSKPMHFSFLK